MGALVICSFLNLNSCMLSNTNYLKESKISPIIKILEPKIDYSINQCFEINYLF
jgi:hypothetical protein